MRIPAYFQRSILAIFLLAGFFVSTCPSLRAQSGIVDPVFGGAGLGLAGTVQDIALQANGQLLVASGSSGLVRLNADGTTDTSFNPSLSQPPSEIAVQSDGKILLYNKSTYLLSRLNADGTTDSSFAGYSLDEIYVIVPQSDGKIMLGTSASEGGNGIYRLNNDGSIDGSFSTTISGPTFPAVSAIVIQSDGRYVIGGTFTQVNGVSQSNVARLKADGTLDGTFNPAVGSAVNALAVQGDGKLLVAINAIYASDPGLIRLNTDGSTDTAFLYAGSIIIPETITLQSNGQIVLGDGGLSSFEGGTLIRVNTDGSVDASFNVAAINTFQSDNSRIASVIAQADGTLLIGGPFTQVNNVVCNSVAKLNTDGSVDTTYTPDEAPGPNGPVTNLALQADGEIIICGSFSEINGTASNGVARLKTDGTRDAAFNPTFVNSADGIIRYSAAVQSSGQIVVGGFFSSVDGVKQGGLVRLNPDGSVDTTFQANYGAETGFLNLTLQPDDKILGAPRNEYIMSGFTLDRLNEDGRADSSFQAGPDGEGADVFINAIVVQTDGKILVSFNDIYYDSQTFYRLDTDGGVDMSFQPDIGGATAYNVTGLALQSDGKILIGGSSNISFFLYRLNTDGSLDTSFNTSINGTVNAIVAASDGTVVIGGSFTQVDGSARQNLAHLSADGTLNPFLAKETGTNGTVNTLVQQPDGKVLLGGNFTSVDSVQRNYVARLTSNGTPDFFFGNVSVGNGFYYLQFSDGTPFGYYNLAGNGYAFPYFYHADLGMEYFIDANDGLGGAYMYDFASSDFFYTSPNFGWPYLYDFNLKSVLYYYPDPNNAGHYNTNGIRYFYDFASGTIITK